MRRRQEKKGGEENRGEGKREGGGERSTLMVCTSHCAVVVVGIKRTKCIFSPL